MNTDAMINGECNKRIAEIFKILDELPFERAMAILASCTSNLIDGCVRPKNLSFARDYMEIMKSEVLSTLSDEGDWN